MLVRSSFKARRWTALLVGAVVAVVGFASAAPALAAGNADFVGTWNGEAGGTFTISSENSSTGVCEGRPQDGFHTVDCRVSGNHYAFRLTLDGSDYYSDNSGTIDGNKIHGSFTDSNGTTESYVSDRADPNTTTAVRCESTTGVFRCTATVDAKTGSDAPSGRVQFAASVGPLTRGDTCTLTASSTTTAECAITVAPTEKQNTADVTLTATYTSDPDLDPSQGTTVIPRVRVSVKASAADTYLANGKPAKFAISLSRASDLPVSMRAHTVDGTGSHGAKARDGDYMRVHRTVTVAAGRRHALVSVLCEPQINLRHDAPFSLSLAQLDGAVFGTTGRASLTVFDGIDPDLVIGRITDIGRPRGVTGPPDVHIKRYRTGKIVGVTDGTVLYMGDEIVAGKKDSVVVEFVIGGRAGVPAGARVQVTSMRGVTENSDGQPLTTIAYRIIMRQAGIWAKVATQNKPLLIQTNGGVMGIKG